MVVRLFLALPAAALLLAAADSHALCLPTLHHINIGSSKVGTGCDYVYADIQTAITNACPNTVISITNGVTLANVALEINGKSNLTLVGLAAGTTCLDPPPVCDPSIGCGTGGGTPPAPNVTLQGDGAGSVIYIHGNSSVTLESLKLTGGGNPIFSTNSGGGIHFSGSGSLTLIDSTITNNNALYGAGIQFNGSGGAAALTLGAGTIIEENTAFSDGGGIHIDGNARLFALAPYTSVGYNHAPNGYGGGVAVIGPSRADIGSPGFNGAAAISFNAAQSGGGIAVIDNGSGEAVLREFATNTSQPTAISNNTASANGGGIFATGQANACLFAPYFYNNIAEDGAAIYYSNQVAGSANVAADSGIYINGGSPTRLGAECGPELVADLGGKECRPYDAQCSAFVGSTTQHANHTPAAGGVISMEGGDLVATRFRIRTSVAGYAVYLHGTTAVVNRCLITDNQVSTNLIYGFSGVRAEFRNCTVANNTIDDSFVFWFNYFPFMLDLANDIVDQPGKFTAAWDSQAGGVFNVDYVLTNNVAGLPTGNPSIVQGSPAYVDATNGDYHLAPFAQKALDFGNASSPAPDYDLDGGQPNVDLPVPNFLGPGDLGAYERQNLFYNCGSDNSIFCDGFDR